MPISPKDAAHFNRVESYAAKVDRLYQLAIKEAVRIAEGVTIDKKKPFSFNDYPAAKARANKLLQNLTGQMQFTVLSGIEHEWHVSNAENDALVKKVFPGLSPEKAGKYMNRNLEALKTFQERKTNGMNLSEKIWKLQGQFKSELELGIDVGLSEGRSAQQMSQDIRQNLNQPDNLFRRVRAIKGDPESQLRLSTRAKNFDYGNGPGNGPGRGVYRSSYKNAMRVARTETNMAYRESDHARAQTMDFIVGFEVHTSNNHPVTDVCDSLKGTYPKEFKFVGFHPHCRCYRTEIMCSKKELGDLTQRILDGEPTKFTSVNAVKDVPKGFSRWITDNSERAKGYKTQPYFISDNFKTGKISGGLNIKCYLF